MATQKYTATQVAEAIERAKGYASKAAADLGCTVQTIYNYRDRYEMVATAIKETEEKRGDYVEDKLMRLIDSGNVAATIFFCKTKLADRGYRENIRTEHANADGEPLRIIVDR